MINILFSAINELTNNKPDIFEYVPLDESGKKLFEIDEKLVMVILIGLCWIIMAQLFLKIKVILML